MPPFKRDRLGAPECPYITRWVLDLGPLGSLRLHHWYGNDDPRAFHDHPWGFLTIVLHGSYTDVSWPEWVKTVERWNAPPEDQQVRERLRPGSVRWRPARWTHTVETSGAWTLVWAQPKRRHFGFLVWNGGQFRWRKANKYFAQYGNPPCEDA